jgi:hypothetical protein
MGDNFYFGMPVGTLILGNSIVFCAVPIVGKDEGDSIDTFGLSE